MSDPQYIEEESELDAYDGPACMVLVGGTKVIIGTDCRTVVAAMMDPSDPGDPDGDWQVITGCKLDDSYVPADDRGVDQWHYYEAAETLWISARSIDLVAEMDVAPHKHERATLF